jgi:hypothetical protein
MKRMISKHGVFSIAILAVWAAGGAFAQRDDREAAAREVSNSVWLVTYDYDPESVFRFKHPIRTQTGRLTLSADGRFHFEVDTYGWVTEGTWTATESALVLDKPETKSACGWRVDTRLDRGHMDGTHSYFGKGCNTARKNLKFTAIRQR